MKEILFPSSIKTIGKNCFAYCSSLTKIVFNDQVEYLPEGCCKACGELKEVSLPSKLKRIGIDCFYNCRKLEMLHNFNLSQITLEDRSFTYCTKINEIYQLPENATKL